ncbi:metal-dependent hydrolase, partial [Natronomonas sp.]|uniref:metal-dependent hydrolase n=1 Tax=Natronomonas sp. TaxID=2184060 RepID=UPI002FC2892D
MGGVGGAFFIGSSVEFVGDPVSLPSMRRENSHLWPKLGHPYNREETRQAAERSDPTTEGLPATDIGYMLPWGHAAIGYLLYAAVVRSRGKGIPPGGPVLALAIGTQFPDIIDKPFGWYFQFGLIPTGRSFFHSLFIATGLVLVGVVLARHYERDELGVAFAVGYLSHLASDGLYSALAGEWSALAYLVWPLIEQSPESGYSILEMLITGAQTPMGLFEFGLFIVAASVWTYDRMPGLRTLYDGVV